MKKLLVALCALALMVLPLFAQGGAETAVDDSKPITIEFWTHEDAARQALEEKYIAEYTAQHPNVTINVTRQSAEKLRELIQTAFAAGQGPTFFNLPIENEYQYIEAGRVAPADYKTLGFDNAKDLISSYADGMIDGVVYDGDVYGLPLELTNWSIFINKNVFRAAGLDPEKDGKTWSRSPRRSSSGTATSSHAAALTSDIPMSSHTSFQWLSSSADHLTERRAV